jgi:hypothetical protein
MQNMSLNVPKTSRYKVVEVGVSRSVADWYNFKQNIPGFPELGFQFLDLAGCDILGITGYLQVQMRSNWALFKPKIFIYKLHVRKNSRI